MVYNRLNVIHLLRHKAAAVLLVLLVLGQYWCCLAPTTQAAMVPSAPKGHDCCQTENTSSKQDRSKQSDSTCCSGMNSNVGVVVEHPQPDVTVHAAIDFVAISVPARPAISVQLARLDRDTERVPILPDLFHQSCLLTL